MTHSVLRASPAIANLHRLADLNPIPKGET